MLPPGIAQVALFTRPCSPSTGVYNPRAFVPHAASLGQAVAHCRRFSTAATRRCLGSVSVPVCRATLARPVGVAGLVGRYPTNNLIPRRPVPRRTYTFGCGSMPNCSVMGDYPKFPSAVPLRGVGYRRLTHPCATPPRGVRLACLIHAANVHSEPGSNPSKCGVTSEDGPAGPPRPRPRGSIRASTATVFASPAKGPARRDRLNLQCTRLAMPLRGGRIDNAAGDRSHFPSPAPLAGPPTRRSVTRSEPLDAAPATPRRSAADPCCRNPTGSLLTHASPPDVSRRRSAIPSVPVLATRPARPVSVPFRRSTGLSNCRGPSGAPEAHRSARRCRPSRLRKGQRCQARPRRDGPLPRAANVSPPRPDAEPRRRAPRNR